MSLGIQISRYQLDQLLKASKEPSTRDALILPELNAIYCTASALLDLVRSGDENSEQICDDLIQALRVLRNTCAAGETICTSLLRLGVVPLLADTIDALGAGAASLNWTLPAVVAQLLANLSNRSSECATAVWRQLFPLHLTILSHIDSCSTQEATSLTILTCCQGVEGALDALVGPQGAPILTALMHANTRRFASRQECNHTLSLLLGHLVFSCDSLLSLLLSLSNSGDQIIEANGEGTLKLEDITNVAFVAAHSMLLQELAAEAQNVSLIKQNDDSLDDNNGFQTIDTIEENNGSMACLLALLKHLATNRENCGGGGGGGGTECTNAGSLEEEEEEEQKDDPLAGEHQLLQDTLHLIRDIAARDDDGHALISSTSKSSLSAPALSPSKSGSLVDSLLASGLVLTLISMLKALGPITNSLRKEPSKITSELAPSLTEHATFFTSQQLYRGYRSDVLSVIANASHKRPHVQAAVSACGGVELVLAQCQVDEKSPLAREWALWAVRNLCEGSEEARNAIKELKACAAVDCEELQKAGVKVTLDEKSGKLIVGKRDEVEREEK
jgi:ataxin-10